MTEFITAPLFVILIRGLTFLAAVTGLYWAVRSAWVRRKLQMYEFADLMLVIVMAYWTVYTLWLLSNGAGFPPAYIYRYNMRFGGLLTVAAIVALIKDRMLVTSLYFQLFLEEQNGKNGQGDHKPADDLSEC